MVFWENGIVEKWDYSKIRFWELGSLGKCDLLIGLVEKEFTRTYDYGNKGFFEN